MALLWTRPIKADHWIFRAYYWLCVCVFVCIFQFACCSFHSYEFCVCLQIKRSRVLTFQSIWTDVNWNLSWLLVEKKMFLMNGKKCFNLKDIFSVVFFQSPITHWRREKTWMNVKINFEYSEILAKNFRKRTLDWILLTKWSAFINILVPIWVTMMPKAWHKNAQTHKHTANHVWIDKWITINISYCQPLNN